MTDDASEATTGPRPGAKRAAIAQEQAHLDRVHARVEILRARADQRVAAAAADHSSSTFQARYERDVLAHHHALRAARFTFGDVESLAFGRLDLADGADLHVGRVSVIEESGEVLLVDWRAPAAAAFYRATAAQPEGVARRRTLHTRGARVLDLDDEIVDVEAADRLGLEAVTGQGALLAALTRDRSPTMRDVVATIQADQDRIIRTPARGILVVTGGPGTGKTVVALHRVAYLLYDDRDRFEGRGVLVVGPSAAFAEYTARVLPSLGEDRAVQRPIAQLAPPGVVADGWDDPEVAAVKGSTRMVEVCRRLLRHALPPIPPTTRVAFGGTVAVVDGRRVERLRDRHLDRVSADRAGASYHERATAARDALVWLLWREWQATHRAAGGEPPDDPRGTGFVDELDDLPQVTMLRRCYWPELDAAEVLARLAGGDVPLEAVADGLLDAREIGLLRASWHATGTWTVDDVGMLDEVATLVGRPPQLARTTSGPADGGIELAADRLRLELERVDVADHWYRDFAHVVVDEAQDLSAMQWRAVARRGPYASWTVVGDLAQRSQVGEPSSWQAIAEAIGRHRLEVAELTVNYRMPREIVEVARHVLEAMGQDPDSAPRSVRTGGVAPRVVRTEALDEAAAALVTGWMSSSDGTVGVIAPGRLLAGIARRVEEIVAEADRERVRVLDPRTVKGLEFDAVAVVAPDEILAGAAGGHQLYVAVTRATRELAFVATPGADFPGAPDHDVARRGDDAAPGDVVAAGGGG